MGVPSYVPDALSNACQYYFIELLPRRGQSGTESVLSSEPSSEPSNGVWGHADTPLSSAVTPSKGYPMGSVPESPAHGVLGRPDSGRSGGESSTYMTASVSSANQAHGVLGRLGSGRSGDSVQESSTYMSASAATSSAGTWPDAREFRTTSCYLGLPLRK